MVRNVYLEEDVLAAISEAIFIHFDSNKWIIFSGITLREQAQLSRSR
jgi:hypothetical protein